MRVVCEIKLVEDVYIIKSAWLFVTLLLLLNLTSIRKMSTKCFKSPWIRRVALHVIGDANDISDIQYST